MTVDAVINGLYDAADRYADALNYVAQLEDERAKVKEAAILRLMQQPNPLTSTPEKPKLHSASSAEAVVEQDAEYAAHRAKQRAAEVDKWAALAGFDAARLRARLVSTQPELSELAAT